MHNPVLSLRDLHWVWYENEKAGKALITMMTDHPMHPILSTCNCKSCLL